MSRNKSKTNTVVVLIAFLMWAMLVQWSHAQSAPRSAQISPIFSISDDDVEKAKAIIDRDPDAVNARDEDGSTPLIVIARVQHLVISMNSTGGGTGTETTSDKAPPVAELLIAKGADLNATDKKQGATALIWSIARHKMPLAKLLIDKKADVNIVVNVPSSLEGKTALHFAAGMGDVDVTKALLAAGANVNAASKDGTTPLHAAAQFGHAAVVDLLLQKGAGVNAKDTNGRTPLKAANAEGIQYRGHMDVVEALKKNGGVE